MLALGIENEITPQGIMNKDWLRRACIKVRRTLDIYP